MTGPGSDAASVEALRSQAERGDRRAAFQLASTLVGLGQPDEAADWHARAAHHGHLPSAIEWARLHLYELVARPDHGQAIRWLLSAEAAGYPPAAYLLATVAVGGVLLPRDGNIERRLKAAVDARLPPALLAAALHFGRKPDPRDQSLCIRLLGDAAARGERMAAVLLAERLANGEGVEANPETAAGLRVQAGVPALPGCSAAIAPDADGPVHHLDIMASITGAGARTLSERPWIGVADPLLSRDECRLLMASAQPHLRRSQAVDPDTGGALESGLRTSSDATIDPVMESLAIRLVQLRLCTCAGIGMAHAEPMVVLRYAPGEEYKPHRDYLPPARLEAEPVDAGNRARTLCAYLNNVDAGGETDFPLAGVTVAPVAGTAVVFDNLDPDGRPDPGSLHAGLPVRKGCKWLTTIWFRQRRCRAF